MPQDGVAAFKASNASKILLIGSLLYFVSLFFHWDAGNCVDTRIGTICGNVENGFTNVGILNTVIVIAIIVMEVVALADVRIDVGTPAQRMQVEASLAFALVFFTIIKILVNVDGIKPLAFVGLVLSLVVAYGGYLRWEESRLTPPPPPPPGGGGFTA
jgi:hypothetical protein